MANDSQRGYLSGIVQRGARTVSPEVAATPVRPFMPTLVPTGVSRLESTDSSISNDLPHEIETFIEPAPSRPRFDASRLAEQPKIAKRFASEDAKAESTNTALLPDPPETQESAASGNPVLPPALPTSSEALRPQSPPSLDVTPAEKDQWSERLPRLISFSTESLRGNSIEQPSKTNEQISDLQAAAENSLPSEITQSSSVVRVVSHQAPTRANSVKLIDDQSAGVEQIEISDVTSLFTLGHQTSLVVPQQFQELGHHANTAVAADLVDGLDDQRPEPFALRETIIETQREVVVVQTLPEPREPPVTWSPSPVPRDEFSMGRQPLPPQRQESPKLTINRLDVQIVNQSAPPVAPLPPATAPAPRPDGWNNLERYHLGHLDLIL